MILDFFFINYNIKYSLSIEMYIYLILKIKIPQETIITMYLVLPCVLPHE